jgi:hypothetical protein
MKAGFRDEIPTRYVRFSGGSMSEKVPPPMVYVVWEDATLKEEGTWLATNDKTEHNYEPAIMQTAGFLLASTEQGIILTHTWNPDCVAPRDQIPIGMIRSMVLLEPAKPPRKRR